MMTYEELLKTLRRIDRELRELEDYSNFLTEVMNCKDVSFTVSTENGHIALHASDLEKPIVQGFLYTFIRVRAARVEGLSREARLVLKEMEDAIKEKENE